jgi:ABC-type transport system involved in multi-copper enzyme maturation permease subunit
MSMLATLDRAHLRLLIATQLRALFANWSGVTALIIFGFLAYIVAAIITAPLSVSHDMFEQLAQHEAMAQARLQFADVLRPLVAWWLDVDDHDRIVDHLLVHRPVVLSAFTAVVMAFVPFATTLLAFNQTAGEIRNRSFRYLVVRTARANVFVARLVASWLLVAAIGVTAVLVALCYIALSYPVYPALDLVGWAAVCALAMAMLALPYVALLGWVSAAVGSARAAWFLGMVATVNSYVFINIVQGSIDSPSANWLDRLTPWGWKYDLLHPDPAVFAVGLAALLGFTLLFGWLGLRTFARRDL